MGNFLKFVNFLNKIFFDTHLTKSSPKQHNTTAGKIHLRLFLPSKNSPNPSCSIFDKNPFRLYIQTAEYTFFWGWISTTHVVYLVFDVKFVENAIFLCAWSFISTNPSHKFNTIFTMSRYIHTIYVCKFVLGSFSVFGVYFI